MIHKYKIPLYLVWFIVFTDIQARTVLIDTDSSWKYNDQGIDLGTAWKEVGFNDSDWDSGQGVIGFGNNNIDTTVNNHQSPKENGAATWYFRHKFNVETTDNYDLMALEVIRDDGAVIYLNGTELNRLNMPDGQINFDTLADSTVGGYNEYFYYKSKFNPDLLIDGENVIAVELHQRATGSSDIIFDLKMIGLENNLLRGPYLQNQSPNEITLRWRTVSPSVSQVNWGTQLNNLNHFIGDSNLKTEHEIRLSGLNPNQKYYYSIGTNTDVYAGDSELHFFKMPPTIGSRVPIRLWVLGDSGTADGRADAVKNSYLAYNKEATDLWMMLGDNAYGTGTDDQYQSAVFDMYPELLINSTLWSTIGNHDRANASSIMQTGVYYDTFNFPKFAQTDGFSSGVDSGTEAYYSFDYGNIHFVVLESHETNATFRSGMINWLNSDLMMTDADWIIAVWHHPPYTKGSHDSDKENRLIFMRENILHILEERNVDLVLTGHSHSYERSWLIDGHYGHSDSFNPALHLLDGSEGTPGQSPYFKPTLSGAANEGTVYVVAGSSGKISGNQGEPHEALRNKMPLSVLGSLVVDVNYSHMNVKFLTDTGEIYDEFRITKGDNIFSSGFEINQSQ